MVLVGFENITIVRNFCVCREGRCWLTSSSTLPRLRTSSRSTSTPSISPTSTDSSSSESPTFPSPRLLSPLPLLVSSTPRSRLTLYTPTSRMRSSTACGLRALDSSLALWTTWVSPHLLEEGERLTDWTYGRFSGTDARRHVNKMCLTANVPLIESGTAGFAGQVQPIIPVCGLSHLYARDHISELDDDWA